MKTFLTLSLLVLGFGGVARASTQDITYTVYSCTCSASWGCAEDDSVHGTVTSTPGAKFQNLSQYTSKNACWYDLKAQIGNACDGHGKPTIPADYNCTSEQSSTPQVGG